MKVYCAFCDKKLTKPGAILFGTPDKKWRTKKTHLCAEHYKAVLAFIYVFGAAHQYSKEKA